MKAPSIGPAFARVTKGKLRLVLLAACLGHLTSSVPAQTLRGPTFTTSVELVSVSAVVRDPRGRVVRGLSRDDFEIFEKGRRRRIVDFGASDQGPISLALLFDTSGSMRVADNMESGKGLVRHLLRSIEPRTDEVALFTFDKVVREEVPFTNDFKRIRAGLGRLTAIGLTSLYDAIAETARTLAGRSSPRRAIVVITDGVDTSSTMTASAVSGLASSIDVPVYVIAVVSPLDHPGTELAVIDDAPAATNLGHLAHWTGGSLTIVSAQAHARAAVSELVTELRHQYLLAFESASAPGWYSIDVRTRNRDLNVRARSGYFAGPPRPVG